MALKIPAINEYGVHESAELGSPESVARVHGNTYRSVPYRRWYLGWRK